MADHGQKLKTMPRSQIVLNEKVYGFDDSYNTAYWARYEGLWSALSQPLLTPS